MDEIIIDPAGVMEMRGARGGAGAALRCGLRPALRFAPAWGFFLRSGRALATETTLGRLVPNGPCPGLIALVIKNVLERVELVVAIVD